MGDKCIDDFIVVINDLMIWMFVGCECGFFVIFDGFCWMLIVGFVKVEGDYIVFYGMILMLDGLCFYEICVEGKVSEVVVIGCCVGEEICDKVGFGFFFDWI